MIRVFTTFSGYDSQCLALKKAGIDFELVGWSEIDKTAIEAHNLIFPEYAERNYGDIRNIDWNNVPDFDFLTYSSPCQDISISGLRRGLETGSGTRSSLLWECQKAIETKCPKYLMLENVKMLVGKKFYKDFERWLSILNDYGYKSYWKVMRGSDYGIPQVRDRVFAVSILNPKKEFEFQPKVKLEKSMEDYMEKKVSEEYYFTDEEVKHYINDNPHFYKFAGVQA